MTSRRPMTRSYSGNGRMGSQNGDDVSSPRLDSRNYLSNVRPENRSTFCTVMAQLTEETQPCFETTIKSKAVSEACNVKFTCVVTGYPVPELTWYKDDMELDRYCGLPKYEIFRNGKIHTLHIYNCTVDDAAIYQASARNSKGIVSCSGVLEVGLMNEYEIHQRFFAKLKQKAELKRRELEGSRRREKENVHQEQLSISPDRSTRKRRLPEPPEPSPIPVQDGEDFKRKEEGRPEESITAPNEELNGILSEAQRLNADVSDSQKLNHVHEKSEIDSKRQSIKEKLSRKKIRISNGFDDDVTNEPSQNAAERDGTHEGMSLAMYLAESLQSQVAAEQQRTMMQSQEIRSTDITPIQDKEGVKESKKGQIKVEDKETESSRDREREKRQLEQRTESKVPEHKEPEPQHKSALSSVFSSLKGIFFGKSKKPQSDMNVDKEVQEACSYISQTPAQELDSMRTTNTEPVKPVEVDEAHKTVDLYVNRDSPQLARQHLHLNNESVSLNTNDHTQAFSSGNTENILPSSAKLHENLDATMRSCLVHEEENRAEEEVGAEALAKIYLSLVEATDGQTKADRDEDIVELPRETAGQECAAPVDQVTQAGREMAAVQEPDDTADLTPGPEASPAGPNTTDPDNLQKAERSGPVSHVSLVIPDTHEEEKCLDKKTGHDLYQEEFGSPAVEEMAGECSTTLHEGFVTNQGSEDMTNAAIVGVSDNAEKTHNGTVEVTKQPDPFYERREESATDLKNEFTQGLGVSQMVAPLMDSSRECDSKQNKIVETIFVESVQEFGTNSSNEENCASEENMQISYSKESTEEKKETGIEEKKGNWTEDKNADGEKNKNVIVEENKSGSSEQATAPGPEISKYIKPEPAEGVETFSSPGSVDKPKIFAKVQPERLMAELRDQSVVPPIVILPDTRETVIKNVAKMRATPVVPEIKVTVAEKIKREEPSGIPRIDVLVPESEKVMQPLAQEVAHLFRDNEPKSKEPTSDAIRTPKEITRDDRAVTTSEPVGVTSMQQERNVDLSPSDQRNQEVKPQNLEARVGDTVEPVKNISGWSKGNDSSIPLISIACADDVTLPPDQEPVHGKPVLDKTVLPDNVAISTPHTENNAVNNTETAPDCLVRKVEGDLDLSGRLGTSTGVKTYIVMQEQSDKRNVPETQPSSGVSFSDPDSDKVCLHKDGKLEPEGDRVQREKPAMEKLGLTTPVGPTLPPLSPASLRRLMAKNNPNIESQGSIPAPSADGSEKKGEESGGSTPTSNLSCESSPKMKRRDSLTLIPSATPEELASGARRKIYLAKTKSEDEGSDTQNKRDSPYLSPSQARRAAFLQLQSGQQTPPMERRSPLLSRRKATLEVPKPKEETSVETEDSNNDSKNTQTEKLDPFKAPQVIRKIRGELFSDASGHLKLWCQFFNVLSDSTIKWFRDEEEILELKRSAGDESPVALAIVQASSRDCGVYGCMIKNEYGTDTTDYLLSADILAEFFLRDDLEVGEEIEMTPLLFTKGLADPGYWGDKFFGRIMTEEVQIGEGCERKTSRAKVIYGLDPVFESGSTCIAKVKNPIAYGSKEENSLAEKNLEVTKQECKIQNTVREYCKIFAAEARVIDNFGFSLEVIPLYLMYRPANTIPYATVEADLKGEYLKYCIMDSTGRLISGNTSEVEQKCCTFQHWIHQWTNGNLLVTRIEGVDTKITNIKIATKSRGYQGLTDEGSPKILEQFVIQHQCNYYCGLLGLRPLKSMDTLQQPKVKTSRSPLLARRASSGSSSPQLQKKGSSSPLPPRKATSSPKVAKKTGADEENNPTTKHKTVEVPKTVRMR